MRRLIAYLLAALLVASLLFVGFTVLYTGLGRVTDSSLQAREKAVRDLEEQADRQETVAGHWLNAEKEYSAFRGKYLIGLDHFADFRRTLAGIVTDNGLMHSGLKYNNQNSPDGKLISVHYSFNVTGAYGQIRHLIWDLEHLPHAARIGKLTLRQESPARIQCTVELEVIFERK